MSSRKLGLRCFFIGAVLSGMARCLIQDLMGLEGYIIHLYGNWTTLPWGVWVLPMALLFWWLIHTAAQLPDDD